MSIEKGDVNLTLYEEKTKLIRIIYVINICTNMQNF